MWHVPPFLHPANVLHAFGRDDSLSARPCVQLWTQRRVYACRSAHKDVAIFLCAPVCVFLLRTVLHMNTAITYNDFQCALTQRTGSRNEPRKKKTRRDDNGGGAAKQEGRGGRVSGDSCARVSVCSLAIAPFSSSSHKLRGSCPSFPFTAQRSLRIRSEARERHQSFRIRRHTDTHEKIW